jgi:hypothetical protein
VASPYQAPHMVGTTVLTGGRHPSGTPVLSARDEEVVWRTRRFLAEEKRNRTLLRPVFAPGLLPLLLFPFLLWLLVLRSDYLSQPREEMLRPIYLPIIVSWLFNLRGLFGPSERERDAAVRLAEYPVPDALPALIDTWRPAHGASKTDVLHEWAMLRVLPEQLRFYGSDAARSDSATGPLDARSARTLSARLASLYVPYVAGYRAPARRLSARRADLLVLLIRLLHFCPTSHAQRTLRGIARSRARNEHEALVRDVAASCSVERT